MQNVYEKLGWKYDITTGNTKAEATKFSVENNHSLKVSKIRFLEAGDDCEKILTKNLNDALRNKSEMLELLISLNNPSCSWAYEVAKKKGFVFSGILPGGENDYLVMQMIVGEENSYEHLVAVGDFEEVKKDIMAINKIRKEEIDEL